MRRGCSRYENVPFCYNKKCFLSDFHIEVLDVLLPSNIVLVYCINYFIIFRMIELIFYMDDENIC